MLRAAGHKVEYTPGEARVKKQMKTAAAVGARHVVLVGADEMARGTVQVKTMETGGQAEVSMGDMVAHVRASERAHH